jgi:hypothetical protein
MTKRFGIPLCVTDWSKLKIVDGVIHYRIYQQDGTIQAMTCADTVENRNFVSWVQIHDRFAGATMPPPLSQRP